MPRTAKYTQEEAKKAKLASDAKRQRENLDRLVVQPYKEEGATIRAAAVAAGQPLQAYILQAVRERMERERAQSSEV